MQHHFTVPAPIEVAWAALLDPERVAPCMPGATLIQSDGSEFTGSVKVKFGPISLLYKGTGSFSEVDADVRRVVIDASGKDSRGNGTASASVAVVLTEEVRAEENGSPSTAVQVDTDLKVTGKPAQFGRGLISEVGDKILGQFAECLAGQLAEAAQSGAAESEAGESGSEQPVSERTSSDRSSDEGDAPAGTGEQAASASAEPRPGRSAAPPNKAPGWRVTPPADKPRTPPEPAPKRESQGPSAEPIDLLDTAGTPVLKRMLPVAVALGAAIGIAVLVGRRRRRR